MNAPLLIDAPVYKDFVLDNLRAWRDEGLRTALLTLVQIDGRGPRPLGSQIAVAEDGRAVGAITGGCAERALVVDALSAISRGENHTELYGEGSRFRDIVLPCGSGLHVHFDVTLADADLDRVLAARRTRVTANLQCGALLRSYLPQCRLVMVGQGPAATLVAQLAAQMEMAVEVFSPDTSVLRGIGGTRLIDADNFDANLLDAYTALAMVFHDHSFEPDILRRALDSDAFFIGALGSRPTHERRLETLKNLGATDTQLARIHGPVGLDIGARTPPEIALAIIAQVVAAWRAL